MSQQANLLKEATMGHPTQLKHPGSYDMRGLNRHVTVRYRCTPNHGRVFITNSSKSVDALVADVSEDSIGLVLGTYIEPGTPVRIEMGNSGPVPHFDTAATITHTTQLEQGKWQCECAWVRRLTWGELLVSRYRTFHLPTLIDLQILARSPRINSNRLGAAQEGY
jgi:hypothetical protein